MQPERQQQRSLIANDLLWVGKHDLGSAANLVVDIAEQHSMGARDTENLRHFRVCVELRHGAELVVCESSAVQYIALSAVATF
jgi:hypothetical protein